MLSLHQFYFTMCLGLNPVWHGKLYSCTHMATVGVKGLTRRLFLSELHHSCDHGLTDIDTKRCGQIRQQLYQSIDDAACNQLVRKEAKGTGYKIN